MRRLVWIDEPKPSIPNDAVPVNPDTRARSTHYAIGEALLFVGLLLQILYTNGPQLQKVFPDAKWLPMAIACAGPLLSMIKRVSETPVAANYSASPGSTPSTTEPIAKGAAEEGIK